MRVNHIESRLEQQLTLKTLISNSVDNLTKVGYSNITPHRVHARLSALKENWEKFSLIHDAINLAVTKLSNDEKVQMQSHAYFSNNLFTATHESYLEAVEKMNSFLDLDSECTTDGPASSQNSNIPVFFHHARLPRIDIPKFNGSPSDWLSFKDLFSSLILANPSLTSVEKLQYLKTSLVGSASHLLKNTTLTADNFQKAWEALISFYENKRLLVNSALHSLLTIKRMTKESASEMEHLYTNIMQIHRTLETLKRPIHHWDDFFVFIAVQRLDSESVKSWEHHLGSSKEPPTWKQFSEFLITRLLSLQAFEKSRTGKAGTSSTPNTFKSHFQGKTRDTHSNKPSSCVLCSSNHYITNCPQYIAKAVPQRIEIIKNHNLCYNCLGHHRASGCRVTKRCLKCGHKHHTTIHKKDKSNATTSNTTSSTSETSNAYQSTSADTNVLHASSHGKRVRTGILLATAQVLVTSSNGERVKARALVDQGSEISLVSERLVQMLHLPRIYSSISLSGVGCQQSNKTKGSTHITLKCQHDHSDFSFSAHILPKLTAPLPSTSFEQTSWPHLDGLKLADNNYKTPGPIDIILGADVYHQIIEDGLIKGDAKSPIAQRTKFGWIISGPVDIQSSFTSRQAYHISIDRDLHDLLQRFWQFEEISTSTSSLSINEQECERHFKISHLVSLCKAGGFPLQKWTSNDRDTLDFISLERQDNPTPVHFNEATTVHILGLCWNSHSDSLLFSSTFIPPTIITKRRILSTIAKIFDPLGLLAPVIITAKIFIQELWSIKLGWDDPLPLPSTKGWTHFTEQLKEITTFPRWIDFKSGQDIEIHGFCDASQLAICATVYIRTSTQEETFKTHLLCAKTKVAPLKKMTIPRLELTGAIILTKLVSRVLQILELNQVPVWMWTDSAIVHTWINNHPSRWKDFVHNRVCYIHEGLPQAIWRIIPGKENPADCGTRGMTPSQLLQHTIWWSGPHWLSQDSSTWPKNPTSVTVSKNLEERSVQILTTNYEASNLWDLINRYSNLTRLLRITVSCMRAIARFKKSTTASLTNSISTQELEKAKFYWIRMVQRWAFPQEMKILSDNQPLPRSSTLLRLTPFLDSQGLLRVGGRLQAAPLSSSFKHPLILPRNSALTSLIISDAHARTFHGGTQLTLSFIRTNYWIVGGRAPVRSFILKCVKCARYRQKRAQQIMGQLPPERVTPSRPFLNSGVDYAGPFILKNWKGRNSRTYKGYIALFVCLSTSAIHIELVTDYSTDAFLAAYKRFVTRRGICLTLTSDCGTNLKGADSELQKLFLSSSKELGNLSSLLAKDGTQWKFIPPATPHFGGKWEAGVKSVKYHLKRVVGNQLLTYEEMTTMLIQIEAILNSRPLCALTDDPDDLSVLTPAHFLIGSSLSTIPEPSLETEKISRLSRWQLTRQMVESFWTHWTKEYLQRYLSIYKWNRTSPPLPNGTLVLVVDERYPPSKWPLGRIIKSHPGKDGQVRVVTIRTQTSTFKRPIVKLCPLPNSN